MLAAYLWDYSAWQSCACSKFSRENSVLLFYYQVSQKKIKCSFDKSVEPKLTGVYVTRDTFVVTLEQKGGNVEFIPPLYTDEDSATVASIPHPELHLYDLPLSLSLPTVDRVSLPDVTIPSIPTCLLCARFEVDYRSKDVLEFDNRIFYRYSVLQRCSRKGYDRIEICNYTDIDTGVIFEFSL